MRDDFFVDKNKIVLLVTYRIIIKRRRDSNP